MLGSFIEFFHRSSLILFFISKNHRNIDSKQMIGIIKKISEMLRDHKNNICVDIL